MSSKRLILRKKHDFRQGSGSRGMKYRKSKAVSGAFSLVSLLLIVGALFPTAVRASVLTDFLSSIVSGGNVAYAANSGEATGTNDGTGSSVSGGDVENMPVLQPATNFNPAPTSTASITVVDNSALVPQEGPSGTIADIVKPAVATISTYVVQQGDTLSSIAQQEQVPVGMILLANDLTNSSKIHPGEQLDIVPITSIKYTVKAGDTLESIAKRYNADPSEIGIYNNVDDSSLAAGSEIFIPDVEAGAPSSSASTTASTTGSKTGSKSGSGSSTKAKASAKILSGSSASCGDVVPLANNPAEPSHDVGPVGTCTQISYYIAPLARYIQTQNIHGYNAVDLAAPVGTPIMAAADGRVIIAKEGGWNGGYGSYVVITHPNGSQTLYAHMSQVVATEGETVAQGEVIGYVGETGDATGPHVHFEIRDGIRNPF